MTEEESKLLSIFEDRFRQLISLCNDLKVQKEALQILCKKLEQENRTWKNKYTNLKLARAFFIEQDDFKNAKNKLAQLVKRIDKCIALLNE